MLSLVFIQDLLLAESDDGINFKFTPAITLSAASVLPKSDTLLQPSMTLCSNPKDSLNHVFIWTDGQNGDADIYLSYTKDGKNWSSPKRMNDDAVGNGFDQDMCWAAFSVSGYFGAAWRDRRNQSKGQISDYDIYGLSSLDGGATLQKNIKINQSAGGLFIPVDGNDFIGVDLSDSFINCSWADKRTGKNQLFFNRKKYQFNATSVGQSIHVNSNIKIYPNPASNAIYVELNSSDNYSYIEVQNMLGQQVIYQKVVAATQVLNSANLSKGFYILHIYNQLSQQVYTYKIEVL